ncbi:MAG: hypothetical protein HY921_09370 [Elusimicrobia bacterium]|nr:hypothetical protein [Elusimicrobiota bacterium]
MATPRVVFGLGGPGRDPKRAPGPQADHRGGAGKPLGPARKALEGPVAGGQVELALRLAGDPLLPLLRAQDPLNRLAASRESYRLTFGKTPAGFVPGVGALKPSLLPSFKIVGLSWVAAAEYSPSSGSWASASGTVLVPFKAAQAKDLRTDIEDAATFVIDEADGLAQAGEFLHALPELSGRYSWLTVSEAVKEKREAAVDAAGVSRWPTWTTGLEPWTGDALSQKAWRLYSKACEDLERYTNSGAADLGSLEKATDELYRAQANRYYRLGSPLPGDSPEALDKELRSRLIAVYRRIKQTPPDSLYHSILGENLISDSQPNPEPEPTSTDVRSEQGEGWLSFENPPGSLPLEESFRILGLRVDYDEAGLSFILRLAALSAAPRLDVYIDLNHVPGAGSSSLLEGRKAFLRSSDGWEYAMAISGSQATLYRSTPVGAAAARELAVETDPSSSTVKIRIPRGLLRGDPKRWGYLAVALEAEGGAGVAGIVGTLEQQKAFLENLSGDKRLAAVRLPKGL